MPILAGPPPWRPDLSDVGAFVPTRTRPTADDGYGDTDPGGGTFTAHTTPTATQVQSLIDGVVAEMTGKIGAVPDVLAALAKRTAALGAAADVEISFPTGSDTPNVSDTLRTRYEAALADLVAAATRVAAGQPLGPGDYLLPVGADSFTACPDDPSRLVAAWQWYMT